MTHRLACGASAVGASPAHRRPSALNDTVVVYSDLTLGVMILITMAPLTRAAGELLAPTERQIEVLLAYVHAGSHDAAGHLLGLSGRTVQAHLTALRTRLGVHNEAQAVYALWLGYRDHLWKCDAADHQICMQSVNAIHRGAPTDSLHE
jgi:DNA-binding CsgD family transcriptional regulator